MSKGLSGRNSIQVPLWQKDSVSKYLLVLASLLEPVQLSDKTEMTFTDDDVKRLKAKEGYWKTTIKMNEGQSKSWGFVDGDKIDALLARLEAAERALLEAEPFATKDCDNVADHPFGCQPCRLKDFIADWRKACGK
jgi:hypothetical protein